MSQKNQDEIIAGIAEKIWTKDDTEQLFLKRQPSSRVKYVHEKYLLGEVGRMLEVYVYYLNKKGMMPNDMKEEDHEEVKKLTGKLDSKENYYGLSAVILNGHTGYKLRKFNHDKLKRFSERIQKSLADAWEHLQQREGFSASPELGQAQTPQPTIPVHGREGQGS